MLIRRTFIVFLILLIAIVSLFFFQSKIDDSTHFRHRTAEMRDLIDIKSALDRGLLKAHAQLGPTEETAQEIKMNQEALRHGAAHLQEHFEKESFWGLFFTSNEQTAAKLRAIRQRMETLPTSLTTLDQQIWAYLENLKQYRQTTQSFNKETTTLIQKLDNEDHSNTDYSHIYHDLYEDLESFLSHMLAFTINADEEEHVKKGIVKLKETLPKLPETYQKELSHRLHHAETIMKDTPLLKAELLAIVEDDIAEDLQMIICGYDEYFANLNREGTIFRGLLYALSVVLSCYLFFVLWQLRKSSAHLRNTNSTLEVRVHQRTARLEEINKRLEEEIEERHKIERDLALAKNDAERAAKSKAEFLATMSHEIRTPMNGVIGMTDLLMDFDLPSEAKRVAETAHKSAEHLLQLINDILDYSKMEAGRLEIEERDYDLRQELNLVLEICRPQAEEKELTLEKSVAEEIPTGLCGDPARLRQVLLNLINNAIKFTPQGSIYIYVRPHPEEKVLIEIQDTGIGIRPDAIGRLFQDFSQADASTTREYGGTGLGLAISKKLVEAMGGDIGVKSTFGEGSTFWVTLPLNISTEIEAQKKKAEERQKEAIIPDTGIYKNKKLLVAEDNPVNQIVIQSILQNLGIAFDIVENGRRAVDALAKESYDLILMDMQMPELDGLDATREIRNLSNPLKAHTPIIALTANALEEDRQQCLDAGMDDYLAKPIKKDILHVKLVKWLAESPSS